MSEASDFAAGYYITLDKIESSWINIQLCSPSKRRCVLSLLPCKLGHAKFHVKHVFKLQPVSLPAATSEIRVGVAIRTLLAAVQDHPKLEVAEKLNRLLNIARFPLPHPENHTVLLRGHNLQYRSSYCTFYTVIGVILHLFF